MCLIAVDRLVERGRNCGCSIMVGGNKSQRAIFDFF